MTQMQWVVKYLQRGITLEQEAETQHSAIKFACEVDEQGLELLGVYPINRETRIRQ